MANYDGFLIAAYGDHLLVPFLQSHVGRKPVVGIFQASITMALQLVRPNSKFAIITTGQQYEAMLSAGVRKFLGIADGIPDPDVFGGVAATGITAGEARESASLKIKEATRRLLRTGNISVLCIGGAILIGLEQPVREACIEVLGEEKGKRVRLVDQLFAGMTTLDGLARIEACFDY